MFDKELNGLLDRIQASLMHDRAPITVVGFEEIDPQTALLTINVHLTDDEIKVKVSSKSPPTLVGDDCLWWNVFTMEYDGEVTPFFTAAQFVAELL